jgi:double-stranded uracil-DNA glycosylase
MQHCFDPVIRGDTRLVLLGSLPGAVSLAKQRYYAHPMNQFWRLIGAVIDQELVALDYEARLETLLDAGIGLWDTVAAATRKGSLDSDIRLHRASDVSDLIGRWPQLRALAFNGSKAAQIGRRQLVGIGGPDLVDLPSSSPALTKSFDEKLKAWLALRAWL